MANPSQLRRASLVAQIALLTIVVAGVCGCSKAKITDKGEINKLIDSLANHNKKPTKTSVYVSEAEDAPLFDDNYDWNEDRRVWEVAETIGECDREALWQCLQQHFDDDRYSLAFASNCETMIASVGGLCAGEAIEDLQFPFVQFRAYADTRYVRSLRSLNELKAWYRTHPGMPLYKQQIELCEAALTKTESCKWFTNTQKSQLKEKIKQAIEALQRTKTPIFSERAELAYRVRHFHERDAKKVREEYLAGKTGHER